MNSNVKKTSLERLGRVEGQVRGIARMIEDDRCGLDIVTQMSAVQAALGKVKQELLKAHVSRCIEDALLSSNAEERRRKVNELIKILRA
jgi:DNA-binding FrmR family transcriptional regulator